MEHRLILISPKPETPEAAARIRLHFVGKRRAIEPVYKNNIAEVLEIEAGHMAGLFDRVLPAYGLGLATGTYEPATMDRLDCADEDLYLGTFEVLPLTAVRPGPPPRSTSRRTPTRSPVCPKASTGTGTVSWNGSRTR